MAMIRRAAKLLLCATFAPAAALAADWADLEGRIQFAYFTEDVRSLRSTLASPANRTSTDALTDYYLGLGEYRVLLLSIDRDRDAAKRAAEACVDHLDAANGAQRDFADGLALQAACQSLLATLKPWKAPLLTPRSNTLFARAHMLAPRNPRVLLLEALADKDAGTAHGKLQAAVEAFEAERQRVAPIPSWGAAEAYAHLGRIDLERGDAVGARSELERALLLAPDFALARRLLATITAD
ncbi:MAG TPA: hypothetical protein PKL49_01585 [Steroidobacteraceae bacterium]|nr:hypothetical protein [Steroidobacteraceae bacterium]HNS28201.1 hypothetical protein [Steroidobacteraceae bacterium]